ncbi:hypothetical protein [Lysinibacillus sp. BPa_S21]|uniref:hypothetical protein n=1 Tax=Lysinibacillus sp. BPa_S21 TaxID=2932478 RepID=UPI0020115571|nr:hypothetical protein [Lysinibacillus sp. BPa_S21]MCL1696424.1 hypothetical protein [Lysinibacillus sp. BPa_S21]
MIIKEWIANPYLWTVVVAVLLLMIMIPLSVYFKDYAFSKINIYIGIGILVFAILVSSFSTKEKHIYYNYKNYSEVEQLESDGWEVVTVYDNRKIIHAKKDK